MAEYNIEQLPENIQRLLRPLGSHWIWIGAVTNRNRKDKKGKLRFNGKQEYAHRVVFHLLTGFDLNSGLQANHKIECPDSLCCHPNCLYAGTQYDNVQDRETLGNERYANHVNCNTCNTKLSISPTTGHKYCQVCKNHRRDEWRKRQATGG